MPTPTLAHQAFSWLPCRKTSSLVQWRERRDSVLAPDPNPTEARATGDLAIGPVDRPTPPKLVEDVVWLLSY